MKHFDVIIVGGGPAGLTAALHLAGEQLQVALFEKHPYPRHKVCGEYLSREVEPYLETLGIRFPDAPRISRLQLSTTSGKSASCELPLGGLGLSRYTLDQTLYKRVVQCGVPVYFETVQRVSQTSTGHTVYTETGQYTSRILIGAYGKRSLLDRGLDRGFLHKRSPWLGVKAHYEAADFPRELVGLHLFPGGYGGLSATENGAINFCYLARYEQFKKSGNIEAFNRETVSLNPVLRDFLSGSKLLTPEPLCIAQISFERKEAVANGILMCGDTAGMIHPLCGNGMAMGIHGAKIAATLIGHYFHEGDSDAVVLGKTYGAHWKSSFGKRMFAGRQLQALLLNQRISEMLASGLTRLPLALRTLIQYTHGNPLHV